MKSVVQLLDEAAEAQPQRGVWFVRDGAAPLSSPTSYRELAERSHRYAAGLRKLGLRRGERIAFAVSSLERATPLWFGIMRAGFAALAVEPPLTADQLTRFASETLELLARAEVTLLIASGKLSELLGDTLASAGSVRMVDLDALETDTSRVGNSDVTCELAVVQAGAASIELISHSDLLSSVEAAARVLPITADDVFVSFVWPFREAGLLTLLLPLFTQRSHVLLGAGQFLKRPVCWLEAISNYRGTISFAPPHAYGYCARAIGRPQLESSALDLSSWRVAGAVEEPLPGGVRESFARALSGRGLSSAAFDAASGPLAAPAAAQERPLSLGQQALWFLAQLEPESTAYHVPVCYRVRCRYDADALQRALGLIVARHDALRSVCAVRDGVPRQRVLSRAAPLVGQVEQVDASTWDEARLERELSVEATRPFDLERGPLFRARLFRIDASDGVLMCTAHHLQVDAASLLIVGAELSQLYTALARGERAELPLPETDYGDFVRWQSALLGGSEGRRLREYWANTLRGAPAQLALPHDRPRPPRATTAGAALPVRIDGRELVALRALASQCDTTLYTVLLALFATLLHRRTKQHDLTIASPVLGRTNPAFRGVVGDFVNTLPIRCDLSRVERLPALIEQLRRTVSEALDHQDLPFHLMLEQAELPRDPSFLPLCQVMFQLQAHRTDAVGAGGAAVGATLRLGDLVLERQPLALHAAQFELMLDLFDHGEQVEGNFVYNTDLFAEQTAVGLLRDYLALTSAVVRDPALKIADREANTLSSEERELLHRWNATAIEYPDGRVHRAFEGQAAARPSAIALSFGEASLDYGELNRRANRMARHLRAHGAARDVLIGVAMERSLALPQVLLAILKAGAAYVPLDPSLPRERLRFMAEDAAPRVIVVDERHRALFASDTPILTTEQLEQLADAATPADDLRVEIAGEDLAYVIYTSGSTGQPKGAANTHAGCFNRLFWMQHRYAIGERDRVLHKTPYSFDVSVWELFLPLMAGAQLVVARPEGQRDERYLLDEIEARRITTVHFVPSLLEALLHAPDIARARCLERVICSGEALSYSVLLRFFELLPDVELHNLYGPTEASIDVTAWQCEENPERSVPIGRPIANTQIYILDERRQPVPIGEAGELYIGGVGLARGYHRRPELTAERFVKNPFSDHPKARLYRTGDLARYRRDGLIEYLGRNDDQIKLRGFRVELGEIEAVAREHPAVRSCVVVARALASGSVRLEAFVVSRGEPLVLSEITRWLSERLPEHMVPSELREVVEIPLTHSGKADRKALLARQQVAAAPVAPRTDTERALVEVWREVLGTERVGVHDNYFALGGDSIRSLQLRAAARTRGLDFDLQSLFTHQTIAELALHIDQRAAPTAESLLAPFALIDERERARYAAYADAFPATQLQLGMLYHGQLRADSWAYHDILSFELGLTRDFDEAAMRSALQSLSERHAVLRSCFDLVGSMEPLQLVSRSIEAPLSLFDLRALTEPAAREAIAEFVARDKERGFELTRAPLFRVAVHRLSSMRVQLSLSFHHAILDGWSAATLLRELLTDYLRRTKQLDVPPFAAPTHGFSEFVALERAALSDARARAHFRAYLGECEVAQLTPPAPEDKQRSGARRLVVAVPDGLSVRLHELAAQLAVPLRALLLAAHARALHDYGAASESGEVVTGVVSHGRPELEGAERVLGLFLNTLPLRIALSGASWLELVERIVADERAHHPYRHLPVREILREAGRESPLEVGFNFVNFHLYRDLSQQSSLRVLSHDTHENTAFLLMVSAVQDVQGSGLSLQLEYDAARMDDAHAARIARAHLLAAEALVVDIAAPALASAVMCEEDRRRIESFQQAPPLESSAPTLDEPVHALFERQAARTPLAIAVEAEGSSLTYAELDARANALAHSLHRADVRPGSVVAVCAEPSLARAVAVLGVLKAGCAYLPLDPSFPAARLAYMQDNAGVRHALATRAQANAEFLRGLVVHDLESVEGPAEPLSTRLPASAAAYVIYTSGSTGRPKGIVMPHAALTNLVRWQVEQSAPAAATAQWSAFGFDVSFQEMMSTWASGGRLVMVPEAKRRDVRAVAELLAERDVERLFIPVLMLHELCEIGEQLAITLPALREIIVAGEQLEITDAVRTFFRRHVHCRLSNHYGPSETHVATAERLDSDPDSWSRTPSIGRPIANVRAYVLDAQRKPTAIGVVGELYLAGACVARGYHNDEALTRDRFLPDPFGPADARMYRTGDLAYFRDDGRLAYVGRRDGQLKVRGYRVELAEVEASILAAAAGSVRRVAVVPVTSRADGTKGKATQLAAYYEAAKERTLDLSVLRTSLLRALPEVMVPSTFTELAQLPLTPSGKLDRRALPELHAAARERVQRARVEPTTPLEQTLCELWRELLQDDALDAQTNFFTHGGDSLRAVRLMAHVQRRFQLQLPIAALLEAPTPQELARVIERGGVQQTSSALQRLGGPSDRSAKRPPLFCVHPIGGHVLCYLALARRLSSERVVYGLAARGLDGAALPSTSVAEMAGAYAAEIQQAQPEGPVHLLGWSFGGMLAIEVAGQLREAGRTLAPVVVLDTIAKVERTLQLSDDDLFECVAMELLGVEPDGELIESCFADEQLTRAGRFDRLMERARARGLALEGQDGSALAHVFSVIQSNVTAAYAYTPRHYDGPVVLVRCLDPMPPRLRRLHDLVGSAYTDESNGWRSFCPQLEIAALRGDHLSIVFEPYVANVAALLQRPPTTTE